MHIPVPIGDVVDRITILNLKIERIGGAHSRQERDRLVDAWAAQQTIPLDAVPGWTELTAVNTALWEVEDRLRDHERRQQFDADFIADARAVYQLNDQRARLKRGINERLGSELVEEKSYG